VSTIHQTPWSTALHFIERWWPPLRPEDGVSEDELQAAERRLGIGIPKALRKWYALAGRRQDFMGNQDTLLAVENLQATGNGLPFCWENQEVVQWGIRREDLNQDDPPVFYTPDDLLDDDGKDAAIAWTPMNQTVSEFLPTMVLSATLMSGIFHGSHEEVDEAMLATVKREYDPLPFAVGYHDPVFYDDDTLIRFWRASKGELLMDASMRRKAAVQEFFRRTGSRMKIGHENGARAAVCGHTYSIACRDFWPPYILRWPYPDGIEIPEIFADCQTRGTGSERKGDLLISRFLNWLGGTDG